MDDPHVGRCVVGFSIDYNDLSTNSIVFTTFWPLGFVAFGGPQAHVAILRDHLVEQRGWLDEEAFTELFAIGQVSSEEFPMEYIYIYLTP